MDFLNEYNQYKYDNVGKICFLKCGVFCIAIGIDAYFLSEILGVKLKPFCKSVKVGIPVTVIDKYIFKMINYDIHFCIFGNGELYKAFHGDFDFVSKTKKMTKLLEVFYFKHTILEVIVTYGSGER